MAKEKTVLEKIVAAANSFRNSPSAPQIAKAGYTRPRINTFLNHHSDVDYGLGITHFLQPARPYTPRSNKPYGRRPYVRR